MGFVDHIKEFFGLAKAKPPSLEGLTGVVSRLAIEARLKENEADFQRLKIRQAVEAAVAAPDRASRQRQLEIASDHKRAAERADRTAGVLRKHQRSLETAVDITGAAQTVSAALGEVQALDMGELEKALLDARVYLDQAESSATALAGEAGAAGQPALDASTGELAPLVEKIEARAGQPGGSAREGLIQDVIDQL